MTAFRGDNQVVRDLRRLRRTVRLVGVGLIVAAISQQLAKPREERTWTGRLLGGIPYDFRVPTPGRFRRTYWNQYSGRLFSDRMLGVGWSINFFRARELAVKARTSLAGAAGAEAQAGPGTRGAKSA